MEAWLRCDFQPRGWSESSNRMPTRELPDKANAPLSNLEEWEDFLKVRYPENGQPGAPGFQATDPNKKQEQFRNYETDARPSVREFYRLNHRHQTYDFVQAKRKEFLSFSRRQMSIWEALDYLNTLVDESDPDTDLSQLDHLLQTAEQIRRDGHPRWFILTGLIHDLGKILCLYGEPQWAVVGDTFRRMRLFGENCLPPVFRGQPGQPRAAVPEPDRRLFRGLRFGPRLPVLGHDEYLYQVVKDYLPKEALYMVRYHSFYPAHREGEYQHLMSAETKRCSLGAGVQSLRPLHEKPRTTGR